MAKLLSKFLDLDDVRIAYCEHGAGPVLILLHGNSSSKELLSKFQQKHFRDYHTIALDSRGHGQTKSEDTQLSIHQISEDVIGFCRTKGISRAAVIGYSDGGNIALFLAKNAPEIFHKIVAISPNYLASGTTESSLRLFKNAVKAFRFLARLGLPTRKAIMRFDLMLNDIGLNQEDLKTIQTSLVILYAQHDLIKEDHILDMGRLIPGARVRKIDHCNHMSILYKNETIESIRNFLSSP